MKPFVVAILLTLAAMLPASRAGAAEPPSLAAVTDYLAVNAKKPGVIVRPSGLQYRVVRSGFGSRPGLNDVAHLAYSIHLIDGTLVDSTAPTLPATVAISTLSMRGLSEALQLMHAGDRWQAVVPPELGYGVKGASNGAIPPNQALVFDVTLLSVTSPQPGEAPPENPFSVWGDRYTQGASFTVHP
ncbi:MAG TPA: FKBP-type peptidyl-prolyl cis-trans isomerase [Rhizomicrobium sp.]